MIVNNRINSRINRIAWQVTFKWAGVDSERVFDYSNLDIKTLLDNIE